MTTSSGTISIGSTGVAGTIVGEFGDIGGQPSSLNEFYAGGINVPSGTTGVPTSGTISMDNLRNKTKVVTPTVTFSPTSINEGSSTVATIYTPTIIAGATVYWRMNGNTGRFSGSTSGSYIQPAIQSSTVTLSSISNTTIGDTATITIEVSAFAGFSPILVSNTFSLVDISPRVTSVSPTGVSINEGSGQTYTVNTANFTNGTVIYWNTSADFSPSSGSMTVSGNTSNFTLSAVADATTEGSESHTVYITSGTGGSGLQYTTFSVTINDTSLTPLDTSSGTSSSSLGISPRPAKWTVTSTINLNRANDTGSGLVFTASCYNNIGNVYTPSANQTITVANGASSGSNNAITNQIVSTDGLQSYYFIITRAGYTSRTTGIFNITSINTNTQSISNSLVSGNYTITGTTGINTQNYTGANLTIPQTLYKNGVSFMSSNASIVDGAMSGATTFSFARTFVGYTADSYYITSGLASATPITSSTINTAVVGYTSAEIGRAHV